MTFRQFQQTDSPPVSDCARETKTRRFPDQSRYRRQVVAATLAKALRSPESTEPILRRQNEIQALET